MFGAHFTPMTNDQVDALSRPPTGNSAECIYHEYYDTQLYTSGTTVDLQYFKVTNTDSTITNMPQGGQLPGDQLYQIYDVCCDILPVTGTSSATDKTGILNDMALLLFGSANRPTWLLNVSNKNYGPYSLTTLHGTGGPTGWGWGSDGTHSFQYARNDPSPGWNYLGKQILPYKASFYMELDWAAAATLVNGNPYIGIRLFGVLNRRTL